MSMIPLDHLPRRQHRTETLPNGEGSSQRVMVGEDTPDRALDILGPLIGAGSDEGGSAGKSDPSRWSAEWVGKVKDELHGAIKSNKRKGHELVLSNFADISSQVRTADTIRTSHAKLEKSVSALEAQLDPKDASTSFLPPVLDQLSSHFRTIARRDRARAHLAALKAVQGHVERVARVEEAVWAGRGVEAGVLEDLLAGGTGSETPGVSVEGTRVWTDVQAKYRTLRDIVEDQATRAFAIAISNPPSSSRAPPQRLSVRNAVPLPSPQAPRPDKYPSPRRPPAFTLPVLLDALAQLNLVGPLLDRLSLHVDTSIIRPALITQTHRIMQTDTTDSVTLALDLCDVRAPGKLLQDAEVLLSFLCTSLLPASELQEYAWHRAALLQRLQQHVLAAILEHILIPAMPAAISDVPEWLTLLADAETIESNLPPLPTNEHGSGDAPRQIRTFAQAEAGEAWVQWKAQCALDQVRGLVLGVNVIENGDESRRGKSKGGETKAGWGGWEAMEVKKEREVVQMVQVEEEVHDGGEPAGAGSAPADGEGWGFSPVANTKPLPPDAKPSATGSTASGAQDEQDDGWGFEERQPEHARSISAGVASSGPEASVDEGEGEGWDFDLTPNAPAAPAAAPAPKPAKVREAKKLGKKIGKAKAAAVAPDSPDEGSVVDAAPLVDVGRSTQDDGWGWDDGEAPPVRTVSSTTAPRPATAPVMTAPRTRTVVREEKRTVIETCLVSKATEDLLKIARTVVADTQELSNASLPKQFTRPTHHLTSLPPDILALFRALIFASPHVGSGEASVPTLGMQLANDCTYIADRLEAEPRAYGLDGVAEIEAMRAASTHAYEGQLGVQCAGLERLLGETEELGGVQSVGDDRVFEGVSRLVDEMKDTIVGLGRVWTLVLPASLNLPALGWLLDTVLSALIARVLDMPDIPQLESDRLVELLSVLKDKEVEGLFVDTAAQGEGDVGGGEGVSRIASHAPHWLKYVYLIEVLGASLAEIEEMRVGGGLVDFETGEIVRLVRGLFSESEMREGLVQRLER